MRPIYLDNNATTELDAEVASVMQECYLRGLANPASQHEAGRRARRVLEEARERIAELLGAHLGGHDADRLILTSGGTEANNLAVRGLAGAVPGSVLISAVEHPSVAAAAESLAPQGFTVRRWPVNPCGVVDLDRRNEVWSDDIRLVSVMLGNHETGVIQPVAEIARWAAERHVPVHSDAVQAVGKIPVHFRELGVAALSFSAHKFHGPVGIGGLLVRHGVTVHPILFGGFQQAGMRPGTESVALAVGCRRAMEIWTQDLTARTARLEQLRDSLAARLRAGYTGLTIQGEETRRLPHTLNVAFPGLERQALVMALDLVRLACSTGSACASGSSEPSPVLIAMGAPDDVVAGSIRLSLSARTTPADIDEAAQRILKVANDLRRRLLPRGAVLPPRVAGGKPI